MTIKVYMASKTAHGFRWRDERQWIADNLQGVEINSTWIDECGPDETKDFADLWRRCSQEAMEADVMIIYREPGETLKGALVEFGIAYASGARIILVGDFTVEDGAGSWPQLSGLIRHQTIRDALQDAAGLST